MLVPTRRQLAEKTTEDNTQSQKDQSATMSGEAHYHQDITHTSQKGSPLWLIMMCLNLLFTSIGAIIRDWPCEFTNQSSHDFAAGGTVYGLSIAFYVLVASVCLVANQLDPEYWTEHKKKTYGSKLLWRVLTDILVLVAGVLYLASDNLAQVAPLGDRLNEYTLFTYEDLRSVLLGISLILGLVPTAATLFAKGLIEQAGIKKPELIGIWAITTIRLFPMLMYTVQVDQIYTAIVGEVVHNAKEIKDGTKCPWGYVMAGIVFFVAVSVIWIAVISGGIVIYICQLLKFRKENSNGVGLSIGKHITILLISWPILALYTPIYIALDNRWPWICAAKCHVQEECIESDMVAMCGYVRARIVLLVLLCVFTILSTVLYVFSRCAAVRAAVKNTKSIQLEQLIREVPWSHEERTQQGELHELSEKIQLNHNELAQQGHITDQPNQEEETPQ